jgi:conjugative transfer signal peptidase TraF
MTAKCRIIVQISILTSAVFAAVLALGTIAGVRINIASNSLPPGFYRIAPAGKGRDLLICPTGIAESVSISRGYRPKGAGCGDGYAPLLKPISARFGDTVIVSSAGISINGRLLSNSKQYAKDALGRPLPQVPAGTYTVLPGTVWVISSYNRFSFDSRYFGPIRLDERVRYANPLWLF